ADQLRDGGGADPGGADEAGRARRRGGGEGGRPLGRRLCVAEPNDGARGPRGSPAPESGGGGGVSLAGFPEPLRDPVPDPRREEARDPDAADREVRGHAGAGREDLLKRGAGMGPRVVLAVGVLGGLVLSAPGGASAQPSSCPAPGEGSGAVLHLRGAVQEPLTLSAPELDRLPRERVRVEERD